MIKLKITKRWLESHGYHSKDVNKGYLYNYYGIELHGKVNGWYLFINDEELNTPSRRKV